MARITLWVCAVLFLAVTVVVCDESLSKDKLTSMSKDELIALATKQQTEAASHDATIQKLEKEKSDLKAQLLQATATQRAAEKKRAEQEKKTKAEEKKKAADKKAAKLKEKTKLSDILMEHGAEFLAMKAAKTLADAGSVKQKAAVMEAALKGARAGAVGPLRKVARNAAVAAVKKARAAAKKAGKKKSEIRKLTNAAAEKAVDDLLQAQDKQVKKVAKKWTKKSIKKYPPSAYLDDEDDSTPNNFVAPPSIHLTMDDSQAAGQVTKMKAAVSKLSSPDEVVPEKN